MDVMQGKEGYGFFPLFFAYFCKLRVAKPTETAIQGNGCGTIPGDWAGLNGYRMEHFPTALQN